MGYEGSGKGERHVGYSGESTESLDDAIKAAVGVAEVEDGTTLYVTQIAVTTVGDPNIGSYKVVVSPSG